MTGTIISIAVTIACNLAAVIFIYGKLTERVKVHSEDIQGLKGTAQRHEGEIGELFGHVGVTRR